jgi:O-antigen/teichoic acid export membrane protein
MVLVSLLGVVCGAVRTFFIPRILSVDQFAYWRTFVLYTGYASLLDLGVVTGALLLWSKDPAHREPGLPILGCTLRFTGMEHLALVAGTALLLLAQPRPGLAWMLLALAVYATLFNLLAVTQAYLQSHLRFGAVAFGLGAPDALFVTFLLVLAMRRLTIERLVLAYLAAWALTLFSLWVAILWLPSNRRRLRVGDLGGRGSWSLAREYIAQGWPVLLAYAGFGVMQSADRITVNLTRPIHDFAIYSLSQSALYVPMSILIALSRVAFSYFARLAHSGRAGVYRESSRAVALLWLLLLDYFFAFEWVIRRFLPKYIASLPAGQILLLSVLFLALIAIVQLNTFSLAGRQREFFVGSLAAVALAFVTAWFGSQVLGTLTAVAWSQVVTAGLWWFGNEFYLRKTQGIRRKDILQILAAFAVGSILLPAIHLFQPNAGLATLLYVASILPVSALLFRAEARLVVESLSLRPRVRV